MNKHLRYLSYVAKHKAFVAAECFRQGLYVRGLFHDWHKFLPEEWGPYAEYFYGEGDRAKKIKEQGDGYFHKPAPTRGAGQWPPYGGAAFDLAWLRHLKKADHHWQWWILSEDEGGAKILPMSPDARLEMVCDWCGASKAQGKDGWPAVLQWYQANKGKMKLHPETRVWVEAFLTDQARGRRVE